MLSTSRPRSFPLLFGAGAAGAFIRDIPVESQIGISDGAASLTTGFVPDNFSPLSAGGVPPFGQDMNGILHQLSAWCQWLEAGAPIFYNADFATAIGGYPKGAVLTTRLFSTGTRWLSLVDGNTADPDTDGTNWIQDPTQVPVGSMLTIPTTPVPFGIVPANGGAIGNSSSNADLLADSAQAWLLFNQIWRGYPNSLCPVRNSLGVPVGRGANPNADFAANNQIVVPDWRGLGATGIDTMMGGVTNRLAGVPIQTGAANVAGSLFGLNLHTLLLAEIAAHAHANTLNDPGHIHGLVDPGHSHASTLTDPGHSHASTLTDPGHVHANTLSDPGHVHTLNNVNSLNGISFTVPGGFGFATGAGTLRQTNPPDVLINSAGTGITINNGTHVANLTLNNAGAVTGLTINNAGAVTGLSVSSQGTGLTITNASAGGGGSHNNVSLTRGVIWGLKT